MKPVKLNPGNIWSGARGGLAVFTNPTELAFRKGTLKCHWPVHYCGVKYRDAEEAYQRVKRLKAIPLSDMRWLQAMMTDIVIEKLRQHPVLIETLKISGGLDFIKFCDHQVKRHGGRGEGRGLESAFIRVLYNAYEWIIKETEVI